MAESLPRRWAYNGAANLLNARRNEADFSDCYRDSSDPAEGNAERMSMQDFWTGQLDRLGRFIEAEPMQFDLYFEGKHIGGISAIGAANDAWVVGHTVSYPYMGKHREFVVEKLTPEGVRVRVDLGVIQQKL